MKYTLLFFAIVCYNSLFSQEVQDSFETVDDYEYNFFLKKDNGKKVKTRYFLMDIGFNGLYSSKTYTLENGIDPFELRLWKSTNFNLHFFQQRVSLVERKLNLIYGLTFESHKYTFDNPLLLIADTPEVEFEFVDGVTFKKNRLTANYFTLPLMINLKTAPKKPLRSFQISAGGYVGFLVGANFKSKVKGNKDKTRDNYGLNTLRYGLRGEIGYGPVTMYGMWTLSPFFDEDKDHGYALTPFTIGFVLSPF